MPGYIDYIHRDVQNICNSQKSVEKKDVTKEGITIVLDLPKKTAKTI